MIAMHNMKKMLTPEQYKQFIEIQEQRSEEMRQQRQQANPDGHRSDTPAEGTWTGVRLIGLLKGLII